MAKRSRRERHISVPVNFAPLFGDASVITSSAFINRKTSHSRSHIELDRGARLTSHKETDSFKLYLDLDSCALYLPHDRKTPTMKFSLLICFCFCYFPATFMFGAEAMHVYNRMGNYYYYAGQVPESRNNINEALNAVRGISKPDPYQKYVACVARTFFFEHCTLCFCTDIPNVALCWDYKDEKCAQTQKLVDEQKDAVNNDPNGVW